MLESIGIALPLADLSAMAASERDAAIARLLGFEMHPLFDLAEAPSWPARRVREQVDARRLIFSAHRHVCDGGSSAVIFGELANCCATDDFGRSANG